MRRAMPTSMALVATLALATAGWAGAPGELDPAFGGGDGYAMTDFGASGDEGWGAVVDPNGKIIVAGESGLSGSDDFAVVRYLPGGALDTTFSGNGWTTTDFFGGDDGALAVRRLGSGKLLVAGWAEKGGGADDWHVAVARYRAGGALDQTFGGGDGKVTTPVPYEGYGYDIVVLGGGSFIVVGEHYYNDPANVNDVDDFLLVRYHPNGAVDTDFGNNGRRFTDFGGYDGAWDAAMQDGRLLVTGWGSADPTHDDAVALARYRLNGNLDDSFSGDGKRLVDFSPDYGDWGAALRVLQNGRFVVAPSYYDGVDRDFVLARFRPNGGLDPDFGGGDGFIVHEVAGNQDGEDLVRIGDRWYVVGSEFDASDLAATRFRLNGAVDMTFGGADAVATANVGSSSSGRAGAAQSGKLLIVGYASNGANNDFVVARFLT